MLAPSTRVDCGLSTTKGSGERSQTLLCNHVPDDPTVKQRADVRPGWGINSLSPSLESKFGESIHTLPPRRVWPRHLVHDVTPRSDMANYFFHPGAVENAVQNAYRRRADFYGNWASKTVLESVWGWYEARPGYYRELYLAGYIGIELHSPDEDPRPTFITEEGKRLLETWNVPCSSKGGTFLTGKYLGWQHRSA